MKESEFYERAIRDAAFRHEKLEELRYARKVGVGMLWFTGSVGVAFLLYSVWRRGWDADFGWLTPIALYVGTYYTVVTRIAALEAIEDASKPRHGILPQGAEGKGEFLTADGADERR